MAIYVAICFGWLSSPGFVALTGSFPVLNPHDGQRITSLEGYLQLMLGIPMAYYLHLLVAFCRFAIAITHNADSHSPLYKVNYIKKFARWRDSKNEQNGGIICISWYLLCVVILPAIVLFFDITFLAEFISLATLICYCIVISIIILKKCARKAYAIKLMIILFFISLLFGSFNYDDLSKT